MFEILDFQRTPIGELCLRRRSLLSAPNTVVTEVTLDHGMLMSDLHTTSERRLAASALTRLPDRPLQVLVGGLGLGFTAAEALRDARVERCTVIEFLPAVLDWWQRGLHGEAQKLAGEARLHLVQDDVFRFLHSTPEQTCFDAILLDVDHDPDALLAPSNASFYTPEGLRAAARWLSPDGVLALWSTAASEEFTRALEAQFEIVTVEEVRWWNELIDEEKIDTLFFAQRLR